MRTPDNRCPAQPQLVDAAGTMMSGLIIMFVSRKDTQRNNNEVLVVRQPEHEQRSLSVLANPVACLFRTGCLA